MPLGASRCLSTSPQVYINNIDLSHAATSFIIVGCQNGLTLGRLADNLDESADGHDAKVRGAVHADDRIGTIQADDRARGMVVAQQTHRVLFTRRHGLDSDDWDGHIMSGELYRARRGQDGNNPGHAARL